MLLVRWRSLGRRGLLTAGGAIGIAALCTLVLAIPYLQVRDEQPTFKRSLGDLPALSADFGATDPRLSIWGSVLGKGDGWPIYGEPAFPGAVLLVLAPIGAIVGWRNRGERRRAAVTGGALVVAGAALALGAGPSGWRQYAPYRLLFEYVPGWEALRATGRAWVVGLLGVGLLAGLGTLAVASWLAARAHWDLRKTMAVVASIAVVGVLVEGYAPWTGRPDIRISPVDQELALRPLGRRAVPPRVGARQHGRRAERVPPGRERLRHHCPPSPDPQRLFRLLPAVVGGTLEGDAVAALRDRARPACALSMCASSSCAVGRGAVPGARCSTPTMRKPLRLLGRYGDDLLYAVPPASSR